MTVFYLPSETIVALRTAVANARMHPTPWEKLKVAIAADQESQTVTLADRKNLPTIEKWIENIELPLGWRVAISCEEQPAALLLHLSMSSPVKGRVPSPEAMMMLVDAIGYDWRDVGRTWLEEFDPGHMAANCLIILEERAAGRA